MLAENFHCFPPCQVIFAHLARRQKLFQGHSPIDDGLLDGIPDKALERVAHFFHRVGRRIGAHQLRRLLQRYPVAGQRRAGSLCAVAAGAAPLAFQVRQSLNF